jgi:hypothetical protein
MRRALAFTSFALLLLFVFTYSPLAISQASQLTSYRRFYIDHNWIPVPRPDIRFAPGAILSFSGQDGLKYLSSLSACGIPSEVIKPKPVAAANLQFGGNLEYAASAVLGLSGIQARTDYSRVRSVSLKAESHQPVGLDIAGLTSWMTNPSSGSIPQECQELLFKPGIYIVREAYEVSKGQYVLQDAAGALIDLRTTSQFLSIAPTAPLKITTEGALEFEQRIYTAVKSLTTLKEILGSSGTLGIGPSPPPTAVTDVDAGIQDAMRNSPTLNLEAGPPSVYNAIFTPTLRNTTSDLIDGKESKVEFFIGPSSPGNAVDAGNRLVNPKILNDKSNPTLLVTMTCSFCKDIGVQKQYVRYSGMEQVSDMAIFKFIPLREKTVKEAGSARLGFRITKDGVDLNNVFVNVRVGPGPAAPDEATISQPSMIESSADLTRAPWSRDIDLRLSIRAGMGGLLEVSLDPGTPEIAALLQGRQKLPDGNLRWLKTGLMANAVPTLEGELYLKLVATVTNDLNLKAILTGSTLPQEGISSVLLTDADQQKLVELLATKGRTWYKELFVTGADPKLMAMMESFRTYSRSDRSVRVRIESQGIYLPWQLLTAPTGLEPKADDFWGFRYELSVDPTGLSLPGRYLGPMDYKAGPLIYGQYRGQAQDDVVARLSSDELTYLQNTLGIKGIVPANSRDAFQKGLKDHKADAQLVVTFTHGGNGTIIDSSGQITQDAAGGKLIFAANEYLPVSEINDLQGSTVGAFFTNAPVIFLNGCETGTAGFYATTNQDFAGTFLALGSRGIIVTEAPIWQYFGYNFGLSLLKEMKDGEPITSALLKTRKTYLLQAKNPLGLLYSYYGGADAAVHFQ